MKEISYSIIIPHKNIPKLLQRCLDSIPTREDTEIIVVDDNSDKDIVDFSHFPGAERKDTTIIFNKQCKGAGHARNLGLNKAHGKWLIFADADDYFGDNLNQIMDKFKNTEVDIIYFKAQGVNPQGILIDNNNLGNKYIDEYLNGDKGAEQKVRTFFSEPWSKFIKRDLVRKNNIQYEETIICNDVQFSYFTGYYARKVLISHDIFYNRMLRENSLSFQNSEDRQLVRLKVIIEWVMFTHTHGIKLKNPAFEDQMSILSVDFTKNHKLYKCKKRIFKELNFPMYVFYKLLCLYLLKRVIYRFK